MTPTERNYRLWELVWILTREGVSYNPPIEAQWLHDRRPDLLEALREYVRLTKEEEDEKI